MLCFHDSGSEAGLQIFLHGSSAISCSYLCTTAHALISFLHSEELPKSGDGWVRLLVMLRWVLLLNNIFTLKIFILKSQCKPKHFTCWHNIRKEEGGNLLGSSNNSALESHGQRAVLDPQCNPAVPLDRGQGASSLRPVGSGCREALNCANSHSSTSTPSSRTRESIMVHCHLPEDGYIPFMGTLNPPRGIERTSLMG